MTEPKRGFYGAILDPTEAVREMVIRTAEIGQIPSQTIKLPLRRNGYGAPVPGLWTRMHCGSPQVRLYCKTYGDR